MTPSIPCTHCNGTSFCGASRDKTGKIRTRVACPTCLVHSRLNPNGVYDRVVCSVCGGAGRLQPKEEATAPTTSPWVLYGVVGLVVVSFLFLAFSAVHVYREMRRYRDQVERYQAETARSVRDMTSKEVRALCPPGTTKAKVKEELDEANFVKVLEGPIPTEIWYYLCADGRVAITFDAGRVKSVALER
jgi:hypothetical protein